MSGPEDAGMAAFRRDPERERRQRRADVVAAAYLWRFATRQLLAKLSAGWVAMPAPVAEALATVERWVNGLLPDRPDPK